MTTRTLTVRFLTPAFLGNAEQSGQWRTPPFKHLLREWWRVSWAEAIGFGNEVDRLRAEEAVLFGSAADGTGRQSQLRIRLGHWNQGGLASHQWPNDRKVKHPEVKMDVGSALYLGFGPLSYDKGKKKTILKSNAAIQAGETAELRIAFPEDHATLIDQALSWMSDYGALGGRSRNGWGAILLEGREDERKVKAPLRNWRDCLDRDWAHAIGCDDSGPLIWRTEGFDDWPALMKRLAELKIGFRTRFKFNSGKGASRPESRHWISYPVTKHSVRTWGNARLPNTLRFRARRDEDGQVHGVIFHMPCLPPVRPFSPDRRAIEHVWEEIHRFLDKDSNLQRIAK